MDLEPEEALAGRVSVVIPARNEEANIARAVRSVAAQDDVREILVVDDQSTDCTSEVLEALKAEVSGLRVMRIDSLPPGWLGKTHAAAVGARAADASWLLFTDADTKHLPGSLGGPARRFSESARGCTLWHCPDRNCRAAGCRAR